jgi:hypothetical protein
MTLFAVGQTKRRHDRCDAEQLDQTAELDATVWRMRSGVPLKSLFLGNDEIKALLDGLNVSPVLSASRQRPLYKSKAL